MSKATDERTITVHVRFAAPKRGGVEAGGDPGRCVVGTAAASRQRHREHAEAGVPWRKMLDNGVHAALEDLTQAKQLAPSYVSGILRLTLLAPEIVEAILDGRQSAELQLEDLLEAFPLEWAGQKRSLAPK